MDFTSSKDRDLAFSGCEDPLLSDWLKCINETNREYARIIEDGEQFWIPFMAIPPPVVKELFMISESREFTANTRYIALYLYDKFVCNTFWEAYTSENEGNENAIRSSWEQTCKRISGQAKLRLMSCLQIASKMDTHSAGLRTTQVISILQEIDEKQDYTLETILSSEFEVFKTVDFKVPLGTPLDCVGILIKALGLERTPQIMEIVVHLLDLSFLQLHKFLMAWVTLRPKQRLAIKIFVLRVSKCLQHDQLYTNLQLQTSGRRARTEKEKKEFMAMEINSLYLAASVLLCTSYLFCWTTKKSRNLARKLAALVDIDKNDVRLMADVLFAMAVQVEDENY